VRLQRQESRVTPRWTCAPGITTSTAVAPVARLESSASAVLEESGSPLSYEVSRPLAVLDGPSGPVSSPALDQAPTCREASHLAPSLRPEAASEASFAASRASKNPSNLHPDGVPANASMPRTKRWRRRSRMSRGDQFGCAAGPLELPLSSWDRVTTSEACGFASRFAADYLSWDELEPARRTAALRTYLADPSMIDIGWSGRGRQRADLVTAGRTVDLADGRIMVVEVSARIVSYRRVEVAPEQVWRPPVGEATPPLAFAPASAPPPTVPGWEPSAAWWVRIAPPVRRDHEGRLVIDLALDISARS